MVVPSNPRFSILDTSDPSIDLCDGIYIAQARNANGFDYTESDETPTSLEQKGRDGAVKMKAVREAALQVRAVRRCAHGDSAGTRAAQVA